MLHKPNHHGLRSLLLQQPEGRLQAVVGTRKWVLPVSGRHSPNLHMQCHFRGLWRRRSSLLIDNIRAKKKKKNAEYFLMCSCDSWKLYYAICNKPNIVILVVYFNSLVINYRLGGIQCLSNERFVQFFFIDHDEYGRSIETEGGNCLIVGHNSADPLKERLRNLFDSSESLSKVNWSCLFSWHRRKGEIVGLRTYSYPFWSHIILCSLKLYTIILNPYKTCE